MAEIARHDRLDIAIERRRAAALELPSLAKYFGAVDLSPCSLSEWSDWDEQHGRLSREGVRSNAAGAAEIQRGSLLLNPYFRLFLQITDTVF